MINGLQIKLARTAIGWGVRELAEKADVNPGTVSRFENGAGIQAATLEKLEHVLLEYVEFIPENGGGAGVRLRKSTPLIFVHQDGIYNSSTDAVRFFAMDGGQSIMFTVSREALSDLEQAENELSETDLLKAFDKHLEKIRVVAERVYNSEEPKSSGAYNLTTANFN